MKVGVALLVSLILSACSSGPIPRTDPITDIQRLFDVGLAAIGTGDGLSFERTIDPNAPAAFWRMQRQRFSDWSTYGAKVAFKVLKVEPYTGSYSRVWTEVTDWTPLESEPISYKRSYVRRDEGGWLLTEPPVALLGGEKLRSVEGIDIRYWGIDEDVIGAAESELATSRRVALTAVPPFSRSSTWTVTLYPTAETAGPNWSCCAPVIATGNALSIYPITVGFTSSLDRWGSQPRFYARTGALIWAREQAMPGISGRLANDWWLDGGWAGAVAHTQLGSSGFYKPACAGVGLPSLQQLRNGPPHAGTPGWTADAQDPYYSLARTMNEYLLATYGSEKYWDLISAFAQDVNSGANFTNVVGTTPERLYADSLSWAKKKYC